MAWVLTRGLTTVRSEFNGVFPGRDKASDGSVGNLAHQTTISGHNPDLTGRAEYKDGDSLDEVRAIDVDRDLIPGSATDWMELVVQYLIRRARAGVYIPFEYIIFKRRIWSRSDSWKTRAYNGANAHDKHAHFSGRYSQDGDNWTGSLGLVSVRDGSTSGGEDVNQADAQLFIQEVRNTREFLSDTNVSLIATEVATQAAAKLSPVLNQLLTAAAKEAAEVPPTVEQIRVAVLEALSGIPSAAEKARLLAPLLGDDAVEVGLILSGQTTP